MRFALIIYVVLLASWHLAPSEAQGKNSLLQMIQAVQIHSVFLPDKVYLLEPQLLLCPRLSARLIIVYLRNHDAFATVLIPAAFSQELATHC